MIVRHFVGGGGGDGSKVLCFVGGRLVLRQRLFACGLFVRGTCCCDCEAPRFYYVRSKGKPRI